MQATPHIVFKYFTLYSNISPQWVIDLTIKPNISDFIEENIGENFVILVKQRFLRSDIKLQCIGEYIDKLDFIKNK